MRPEKRLTLSLGLLVVGLLVLAAGLSARAQNPSFGATLVTIFGAMLAGLGLAWALAAPFLLLGRARGGTKHCLHCGAKREAGIAFCRLCGWRTPDERQAALPPVDPWDKER